MQIRFQPEDLYLACHQEPSPCHLYQAGYRAFHFAGGVKQLMQYGEGQDPALRAAMSPALLSE